MSTTDRRGGALLAALWLSAALAAIAFSLANTVRGEAERASTAVDGTRARYLAAGAIQRAVLHMLWRAHSPTFTDRYTPGLARMHLPFPSGEVWVEIVPESAKLNVNSVPPEELFRLLLHLGTDPGRAHEITAAIVDWRTPKPAGEFTPFDIYYLSRLPSFRARHASLEETEEILLVKGMTPEIYYGTYEAWGEERRLVPRGGLADCLSIFGAPDRVDINTAHPAVLAAVGLPLDTVNAIVQRRRQLPFRAEELPQLAAAFGPGGSRLRLGGNSIYTLRATARLRLPGGGLSDLRRTVAAQVKFMPAGYDAPYHILRWYDQAWSAQ